MISFKGRESKRGRIYKMSRNLERLYKEGKCRECKVLVTRMDFAKILGKFTKVKIQYESSTSPKAKKNSESNTPNANSRLKCNENGMVLIRRNTYKQHLEPKDVQSSKKLKEKETPPEGVIETKQVPHQTNNILKENNGMKKNQLVTEKNFNYATKSPNTNLKQYGIVFTDPTISNNNNNDIKSKISLLDILPNINKSILPSEDWCIDFFPKNEEPKHDKVYDRIAAELEDLMYNEKPIEKLKPEEPEIKVEEFPSIMDILNDNTVDNTISKENDQSNSEQFKTNLESSDVEAMLLGKTNIENKDTESSTMEVDSTDVSKLIEDMDQLSNIAEDSKLEKIVNEGSSEKMEVKNITEEVENPQSPSILDEALKKGIEEHLPNDNQQKDDIPVVSEVAECKGNEINETIPDNDVKPLPLDVNTPEDVSVKIAKDDNENGNVTLLNSEHITHVVFKKILNSKCSKSVTCPKNLKYSIELEEKSVEFIGAPKYISSLEDLQVLLQIVNETDLESLHVFH